MHSPSALLVAGMPSPLPENVQSVSHLTRWAMDRLDTISFFLHMKQTGLSGHTEADTYGNHAVDPTGKHSWATKLLPYLVYRTDQIDMEKPWSDPVNQAAFRSVLPELINPEISNASQVRDAEGWGLNHYALNSNVAASGGGWVSDSNQLIVGETNANFQPWGKPGNWRDPNLGINKSPHGFGGPSGKGAYFVMGDGSVRFISADIDASVLRKLAR